MHPLDYLTGGYIKSISQKAKEHLDTMSPNKALLLSAMYSLVMFLTLAIGLFMVVFSIHLALVIL